MGGKTKPECRACRKTVGSNEENREREERQKIGENDSSYEAAGREGKEAFTFCQPFRDT